MRTFSHNTVRPGSAGKRGLLFLVFALATATAQADPIRPGPGQPAIDDVRFYLACNRAAETQLLGFVEAGACSRVFLRIKLAFVPGVTPEDFDRLPSRQKAVVNTAGYLRYLDWSKANAAWLSTLDVPHVPAPVATMQ